MPEIKSALSNKGAFNAINGAPGEVRTRNLWRRRPTLYPIELRVHAANHFANYAYTT